MKRRLLVGLLSACALVASGLVGFAGCSSSSGVPAGTTDSGEMDVSALNDSGADSPENDSSNPMDSSTPIDSGKDAAPTCPDGGTHLPPGFTQVTASAVDPSFGFGVSMALDENDDPMFAYLAVAASVQTGAAPVGCVPSTSPQGCDALYFTRWDPCAGAFTTPVVIDPVLNYYAGNAGTQAVSIAYDRSTKEIGIAYLKVFPTDPNWADSYDAIWLATRKSGQSSFATQQVSDNERWGTTDVSNNDTPSLAMGGGHLYLAFTASFQAPGCAYDPCLRFAASSSTPPPVDAGSEAGDDSGSGSGSDAGTDAGTDAAGPPPPHYFDLSYVTYAPGGMGMLNPRSNSISVAVDSMGRPAVAAYQAPLTGYNTVLTYWRSDMAAAVTVTDTNNVQNDSVSLGMVFEGTSPRVAGLLTRDPFSANAYNATYVSSPDDGTTWNAAQPFVLSGGLGFYTSLATDGNGNEAFTSHYNGSANSPAEMDAGCGPDPFVSRSSNSGAAWSGCTLGAYNVDTNSQLSSGYGQSRIAGKLAIAGSVEGNGATTLDGGGGYSVVYYQDP